MCSSAPTSGWGLDLPNYLKDWVMKEQSENGSGLEIFLNQSEDGISLFVFQQWVGDGPGSLVYR